MSIFSVRFSTLVVMVTLAAVQIVHGFWRLPCPGRTTVARIDPLAQFGRVGQHAHVVHGGNKFHFTSKYEDAMNSQCTSCAVKQDRSFYWTPALYFQHDDGQTELVKQVGGLLAYYLLFGENIQAFPPGFQMIAGLTNRRNFTLPVPDPPKSDWSGDQVTEAGLRQKAVGFNCLNYKKDPEPTLFRHFLPDKAYLDANCPDGIRMEVMFPSCWNGEPDSGDHMSHVVYPDQVITGNCPKGFNKRVISLMYETIWDTRAFSGRKGQYVLSNGDTTGYGYHGDFITGWDTDFLQRAIKTCTNASGKVEDCPLFELQSSDDMEKCKTEAPEEIKDEDCIGMRKGLPGDNVLGGKGNDKSSMSQDGNGKKLTASDPASAMKAVDKTSSLSTTTVPTLSYSSASTTVSNAPAGLNVVSIESSDAAKSGSPSESATTTTAAATTATTTSQSSLTTTTMSSMSARRSFVSTTFRTEGGKVMEVFIVQKTVTVDASGSLVDATGTTNPTSTSTYTAASSTADDVLAGTHSRSPKSDQAGYKHRRSHVDQREEHVHDDHQHLHRHVHQHLRRGGYL